MQQHGSKYFAHGLPPPPPPPSPYSGLKCQNSTFSEHGHVAYQVKGNLESSNMVANVLPANTYPSMPPPPPTPTWGWGQKVKIQLFKHFDLTHTPSIWVRLKSDIEISRNGPAQARVMMKSVLSSTEHGRCPHKY